DTRLISTPAPSSLQGLRCRGRTVALDKPWTTVSRAFPRGKRRHKIRTCILHALPVIMNSTGGNPIRALLGRNSIRSLKFDSLEGPWPRSRNCLCSVEPTAAHTRTHGLRYCAFSRMHGSNPSLGGEGWSFASWRLCSAMSENRRATRRFSFARPMGSLSPRERAGVRGKELYKLNCVSSLRVWL